MDALIEKLKSRQKLSGKEIRELFLKRDQWTGDIYPVLAKRALDMGENFYAYDIAEKINPSDEKMALQKLHIMALALARSGSLARASELLQELPDSNDSEIIGLKSRILKDMAINSSDQMQKKAFFKKAADMSLAVFHEKQQYYNGINAATCLFMAGFKDEAQALVRTHVMPLCLKEENQNDLWLIATMGECYLLLEKFAESAECYRKAAEIAVNEGTLGSFASTLKQFYMLGENFKPEEMNLIVEKMNLPCIAIFSGHMIDRPERKVPRFPAYAEEQVRTELAAAVKKYNIHYAYVSCACGGDILFIEEVLKNNGMCFILPPLPLEAAIQNSVDIIPGANWKERLERILAHDNVILLESECDEIGVEDDAIVYDFTNRFLLGSALHRASALHFPMCGVTVWNQEKSGLTGGTDSAVALWQDKNFPIEIITPEIKK